MEGKLRISKGCVFQKVGAAKAKLREPKPVRSRGTDSKLESDEMEHNVSLYFYSHYLFCRLCCKTILLFYCKTILLFSVVLFTGVTYAYRHRYRPYHHYAYHRNCCHLFRIQKSRKLSHMIE